MTISRVINAPVGLVWEVWTTPSHIKHWYGPDGFTTTIITMDVVEGGEWEFILHGPDGTDYPNKNIYKELIQHKKIVFNHVVGPKFQTTITFDAQDYNTLVIVSMLFESKEQKEITINEYKADVGLRQNIDRLENYLTSL